MVMRGRRLTVGAVAHARRPHYSLSFSRFPHSHPLFPVPMRGRRPTVGAVAHARRPHCSLSVSRFPLSHPPVSGSSTSTPWTTSSRSSTLSSLTLDQTHHRPLDGRSLHGHLWRAIWRTGATCEQPDPTPVPAPALLGRTPPWSGA